MKTKLIVIIVLGLSALSANAQLSYSCYYREYCRWNSYTEQFENCNGYSEVSIFRFNCSKTLFIHTTESMESTYYITGKSYDSDRNQWVYDVTSDVGNDYVFVFDPDNKEIRVLITKSGESTMLRFYVKSVFYASR